MKQESKEDKKAQTSSSTSKPKILPKKKLERIEVLTEGTRIRVTGR